MKIKSVDGQLVEVGLGEVARFGSQFFGFLEDEKGKERYFHGSTVRRIFATLDEPAFSQTEAETPQRGDNVVYVLDRGQVTHVGYQSAYVSAVEQATHGPVFRVVRENRFKGQLMVKQNRQEVVMGGSLSHILENFPRCLGKDPLGPEYKTGPITAFNHWERLNPASKQWERCEDPRPVPKSWTVEPPVLQIDKEIAELVQSTAGKNGGKKERTVAFA